MTAKILIVSVDDIPVHIDQYLRQRETFTCFYSRGGLKTKEILKSQPIDTIIWIYLGHEKALAKDLLKIFNRRAEIPIIFITQSYDELDFAEDIKGLFANLDLNDDLDDLVRNIEASLSNPAAEAPVFHQPEQEPPEIEFKNVVSQLLQGPHEVKGEPYQQEDSSLKDVSLWNAVDEQEKKALSEPFEPEKKNLFARLKRLID